MAGAALSVPFAKTFTTPRTSITFALIPWAVGGAACAVPATDTIRHAIAMAPIMTCLLNILLLQQGESLHYLYTVGAPVWRPK